MFVGVRFDLDLIYSDVALHCLDKKRLRRNRSMQMIALDIINGCTFDTNIQHLVDETIIIQLHKPASLITQQSHHTHFTLLQSIQHPVKTNSTTTNTPRTSKHTKSAHVTHQTNHDKISHHIPEHKEDKQTNTSNNTSNQHIRNVTN